MIYNDAIFQMQAKEQMLEGISKLARAVKSTLGPNGKNCIIQVSDRQSIITKDGYTVARNFMLKDGPEKIGANLVKEVASRAVQQAGDGTTTSIVLAEAIFRQGLSYLKNSKSINITKLKQGIDDAVKEVVAYLKENSNTISEYNQIIQIATISANNDKFIGKIIADAIQAVGIDGTVTVDPAQTTETSYSIVEGMEFSNGFLSPYFINNQEAGIVEFENPFILMYGKKISTLQEILPALQQASQQKSPLLIIADDIEQEVLTALVVNKVKGVLSVAAVKSPGFGEIRKDIMQDIAALTDGTYIDEELGMTLESCNENNLFGVAKKVKITQTNCTIIGSNDIDKKPLEDRINKIKSDIETNKNEHVVKNLKRRLSKLTNGVAVIHVGANSAVEMGEKKDRIDDALCATRAAIEEGIVAGGGIALLQCQNYLKDNTTFNDDSYSLGKQIIINILNMPFETILINAGIDVSEIYKHISNSNIDNLGYDVMSNTYDNMFKLGIIDPLKVTRTALESAASVAGLLLTTECILVMQEEADKNPQLDPRMFAQQ